MTDTRRPMRLDLACGHHRTDKVHPRSATANRMEVAKNAPCPNGCGWQPITDREWAA